LLEMLRGQGNHLDTRFVALLSEGKWSERDLAKVCDIILSDLEPEECRADIADFICKAAHAVRVRTGGVNGFEDSEAYLKAVRVIRDRALSTVRLYRFDITFRADEDAARLAALASISPECALVVLAKKIVETRESDRKILYTNYPLFSVFKDGYAASRAKDLHAPIQDLVPDHQKWAKWLENNAELEQLWLEPDLGRLRRQLQTGTAVGGQP
jgi:hypothetical protein